MAKNDVYAYGVVAASTQYRLAGSFPGVEGYAEVTDKQSMTGGEAANSAIVLANLGVSVRLDGNWLGDDEAGEIARALLVERGVDTTRLPPTENYRSVQEVIFAAEGKRTIFGTYGALQVNQAWNEPEPDDIANARVVCLDPFFGDASAKVASAAHSAGIPVVTVDTRHDDPLLKGVSAIVVAESFIREHYPDTDIDALMADYVAVTDGLVIFTFGDEAIRYARPGTELKTAQPYKIDPVDTTGGGDSFRAGIVYGYLHGWDDARMIDYASAVAAITCTRSPGVLNSPSVDEVARFLSDQQQ